MKNNKKIMYEAYPASSEINGVNSFSRDGIKHGFDMGSIQKSLDYVNDAKLQIIRRKLHSLEPAVKLREMQGDHLETPVKRDIDPTPFGSNAVHLKNNKETILSGSGQMPTFQELQRMKRSGIIMKAVDRFRKQEEQLGNDALVTTQPSTTTTSAATSSITTTADDDVGKIIGISSEIKDLVLQGNWKSVSSRLINRLRELITTKGFSINKKQLVDVGINLYSVYDAFADDDNKAIDALKEARASINKSISNGIGKAANDILILYATKDLDDSKRKAILVDERNNISRAKLQPVPQAKKFLLNRFNISTDPMPADTSILTTAVEKYDDKTAFDQKRSDRLTPASSLKIENKLKRVMRVGNIYGDVKRAVDTKWRDAKITEANLEAAYNEAVDLYNKVNKSYWEGRPITSKSMITFKEAMEEMENALNLKKQNNQAPVNP